MPRKRADQPGHKWLEPKTTRSTLSPSSDGLQTITATSATKTRQPSVDLWRECCEPPSSWRSSPGPTAAGIRLGRQPGPTPTPRTTTTSPMTRQSPPTVMIRNSKWHKTKILALGRPRPARLHATAHHQPPSTTTARPPPPPDQHQQQHNRHNRRYPALSRPPRRIVRHMQQRVSIVVADVGAPDASGTRLSQRLDGAVLLHGDQDAVTVLRQWAGDRRPF